MLDDPISTNRLPAADGAVTLAERTLVGESSAWPREAQCGTMPFVLVYTLSELNSRF